MTEKKAAVVANVKQCTEAVDGFIDALRVEGDAAQTQRNTAHAFALLRPRILGVRQAARDSRDASVLESAAKHAAEVAAKSSGRVTSDPEE